MMIEALDYMDHVQATELTAVEKYLLDELSPEVRSEFEEHFFDCQDCATDLRLTAEFIDAARKELGAKALHAAAAKPRTVSSWPATIAWIALAACLLIVAYQNLVVVPHFKTEVAELKTPEILPSLSLVGGNSRGGHIPAVAVGAAQPFLLSLDIPTQDRFASYDCLLYSLEGTLLWQVRVSAQAAKDTVSIRVPAITKPSSEYTLTVRGNEEQGQPAAVDLAHYRFTVNNLN